MHIIQSCISIDTFNLLLVDLYIELASYVWYAPERSASTRGGLPPSPADQKVVNNVPLRMQTYSWDCGLACASMVLQ